MYALVHYREWHGHCQWRGLLKFTPLKSLISHCTPAPDIIFELLQFTYLGKSLILLVVPDLCCFLLVDLKQEGPGNECRALMSTYPIVSRLFHEQQLARLHVAPRLDHAEIHP